MKRILAVGALFACSTALLNAASFDLAGLIASPGHGSVTVGDKVFSNFGFAQTTSTCTSTGTPAGTCSFVPTTPLAAGALTIMTIDSDPLGIALAGAIRATANGNAIADSDYLFSYTVTVTDPSRAISAIQQAITAGGSGSGGDVIVTETAIAPGGVSANSSVSFNDVTDPPGEVTQGDMLRFTTPVRTANITKDIHLTTNPGGSVVVSLIQQRFEQVPEPTGLAALLGTGLIALFVKKKKQSSVVA